MLNRIQINVFRALRYWWVYAHFNEKTWVFVSCVGMLVYMYLYSRSEVLQTSWPGLFG